MNAKTLIINAILTLAVTVIGGALLDIIQSSSPWNSNKIEYDYQKTGSFNSTHEKVEFSRLKIKNSGSKTQKSIKAEIEFKETTIQDISIPSKYKSLNPKIEKTPDSKKLTITADALFAEEEISIEILTKSLYEETPEISIRSTTTNGTPSDIEANEKTSDHLLGSEKKTILSIVISIAIFSALTRKSTIKISRSSTPNNIGFLLMHAENLDEARKYFEKDLENATSGPFSISNYALYKQLNGETESAKTYLKAAHFYSNSNHEKAVTIFNDAIIDATLGIDEDAKAKLLEAAKLSPKEIKKYCAYSKIIEKYIPDAKELIKNC